VAGSESEACGTEGGKDNVDADEGATAAGFLVDVTSACTVTTLALLVLEERYSTTGSALTVPEIVGFTALVALDEATETDAT
jgi:hypothetical protein